MQARLATVAPKVAFSHAAESHLAPWKHAGQLHRGVQHRPAMIRPMVMAMVAPDQLPGQVTWQEGGGATGTSGRAATPQQRQRLPFDERCQQLALFRQQHGHSRVPSQDPSGLGAWLARQRHAYKMGRLPPERLRRLAALGFTADAFQESWATRFRQLAAFHSAHGHCRVPRDTWAERDYPGLYAWLQQQMHRWRQGTLPDERRRRLEGLGVTFQVQEEAWERRFAELLEFKEEHGHVDVPFQWPINPGLANWVTTQRKRLRGYSTPLTHHQQSRLLSCGFQPDPRQGSWDIRYAQLCELQRERGGSLLGAPLPEEGDLAGLKTWLAFQRSLWRRGRLPAERVEKLEALGLSSGARRQQWQHRLAVLDQLVATLGFPATYSLLVVVPSTADAAAMAAAAVSMAAASAAGDVHMLGAAAEAARGADGDDGSSSTNGFDDKSSSSGSGDNGIDTGNAREEAPPPAAAVVAAVPVAQLTSSEAAAAVRWFRRQQRGKLPHFVVHAVQQRGLLPSVDWQASDCGGPELS